MYINILIINATICNSHDIEWKYSLYMFYYVLLYIKLYKYIIRNKHMKNDYALD